MKLSTALALCLAGMAAIFSAAAQDLAMTASKDTKVLLDNDKVRVLELQIAPGGKTGMHSHGDHFVYFVTGGEAKQVEADGTIKTRTTKPGEILWSGPVTHDSENTGKAQAKVLIVELKEPAK